ncbi:hypothetical protein ACGFZB_17610 [Streptomyces cinerochromogenes]|uniref:Uncharacterized protein n=1 Tax=Streptomyces cinerochromogenes TaxID=66422 RepID=A0ABW7B8L1_9ACTN
MPSTETVLAGEGFAYVPSVDGDRLQLRATTEALLMRVRNRWLPPACLANRNRRRPP